MAGPNDKSIADEVWYRYAWLRDNGHMDYVKKAKTCEDFFAGAQWSRDDLALLMVMARTWIFIFCPSLLSALTIASIRLLPLLIILLT